MEYTKTNWKDLPDTTTPITADRLNNMENGIEYLFENGIGGGDTLPVGAELDYDGNSLPTGWEQISEKEKILWTNLNPTSLFPSQTITLLSDDYDFYEIYFTYNNSNANGYVNGYKSIKGRGLIISEQGYGSGLSIRRKVDYTDGTHLLISDGYGGTSVDNQYLIPIYIIGYKYALFS